MVETLALIGWVSQAFLFLAGHSCLISRAAVELPFLKKGLLSTASAKTAVSNNARRTHSIQPITCCTFETRTVSLPDKGHNGHQYVNRWPERLSLFAARSLQGQVSLIQQHNQDLLWEGGYRQLHPEVGRASRLLVGALREGTVGSRGPSTLVDEVWEPPAEDF